MPGQNTGIDPFWSGVIGAGAGIVGQGINAAWQGALNKKTRKWNEKMYRIQREDALADWNRQNEYNSPAAQMQRFKDAQLNPHLIYGQANEGGSVRSSSVESWSPKANQVDGSIISQMFMMMYDLQQKSAATDLLREQTHLALAEGRLKRLAERTGEFELGQKERLKDISYETKVSELRKLDIENMVSLDANERARVLTQQSLSKGVEEIAKIKLEQAQLRASTAKTDAERRKTEQEIKALKETLKIIPLDRQLKEKELALPLGTFKSDNAIIRATMGTFQEIYERALSNPYDDNKQRFKDSLKKYNYKPVSDSQFKKWFKK